MQPWMHDVPRAIVDSKRALRSRIKDLTEREAVLRKALKREVEAVRDEEASGGAVPIVSFADVQAGSINEATKARIRQRGCAVVRGVFREQQASGWNDEVLDYITRNDYLTKAKAKAGIDKYFSALADSRPQIFGLYWSRPQMQARQHENMAAVRSFMNRLWDYQAPSGPVFDPDRQFNYADRVRRREPGDQSFGLSPHMDGGSVERWCDESFHTVYNDVYFGDPLAYNPFSAKGRTATREIVSPAVCNAFRTFQGWTALTPQGPGDGTLRLVPIANAMGWILLRALLDDVPEGDLCGAAAGRALCVSNDWHADMLKAEVSIPQMQAGDTVWWHSDVCHAVEAEHNGRGMSNVIYIGAAPWCQKNADFAAKQAATFMQGRSTPDFAAEDYEVDFENRMRFEDLSELGKRQMGLVGW